MRIDLACAVCGNNRFALDHDIEDDSNVVCEECGHNIGTMAQLKQKVAAEVLARSSRPQPEFVTQS